MEENLKVLIKSKISALDAEISKKEKNEKYTEEIQKKTILQEILKEQVQNENTRFTTR